MFEVTQSQVLEGPPERNPVLDPSIYNAKTTRGRVLTVVDDELEKIEALKDTPEYKSGMDKLMKAGSRGIHFLELAKQCSPAEEHIIIVFAHHDYRGHHGLHMVHPDLFVERKPLPAEAALPSVGFNKPV